MRIVTCGSDLGHRAAVAPASHRHLRACRAAAHEARLLSVYGFGTPRAGFKVCKAFSVAENARKRGWVWLLCSRLVGGHAERPVRFARWTGQAPPLHEPGYPRPIPTYSNPRARRRTESSRFLVSTMRGRFRRCLMRSKSRPRNSGQPVPTTRASTPSAAA